MTRTMGINHKPNKSKRGLRDRVFELMYHGEPHWDIGHPHKDYIQLEQAGEIVGSVLDVGCGTGENALYLAAQGHEVWGIDVAPTAIQKAQEKAAQRHLMATFRVLSVFELHSLGRMFDTVIDSGLFHELSDEDRPRFVDNLAAVIRRGGTYFMLCTSELAPVPDFSKLKDFMPKDFMPDLSKLKPEDFSKLKDFMPKDFMPDLSKLKPEDFSKLKDVFPDSDKLKDLIPYFDKLKE